MHSSCGIGVRVHIRLTALRSVCVGLSASLGVGTPQKDSSPGNVLAKFSSRAVLQEPVQRRAPGAGQPPRCRHAGVTGPSQWQEPSAAPSEWSGEEGGGGGRGAAGC